MPTVKSALLAAGCFAAAMAMYAFGHYYHADVFTAASALLVNGGVLILGISHGSEVQKLQAKKPTIAPKP